MTDSTPPSARRWAVLQQHLRSELHQLVTFKSSNRPWQMALAAALAAGLPVLIGAHIHQLSMGLLASMGGLVFLYLPNTPLSQRMVMLMASAFVFCASFTLGVLCHFLPYGLVPMLMFITVVVSMLCRFYDMPPPGSLFFVLTATVGAYMPHQMSDVPALVGTLTMGCLFAVLIGFFYSLYAVATIAPPHDLPPPKRDFDFVVVDSLLIGVFVGLSLLLANALQLERPYWVPTSCVAVAQGNSLRAVWDRNLHRIIGTALGVLLASAILFRPMSEMGIAITVMVLVMCTEFTIVRHYAVAVTFVTPLTILLAETATQGVANPSELIRARLIDTVLGCLMGGLCGLCIHHQPIRRVLSTALRRFVRVVVRVEPGH